MSVTLPCPTQIDNPGDPPVGRFTPPQIGFDIDSRMLLFYHYWIGKKSDSVKRSR